MKTRDEIIERMQQALDAGACELPVEIAEAVACDEELFVLWSDLLQIEDLTAAHYEGGAGSGRHGLPAREHERVDLHSRIMAAVNAEIAAAPVPASVIQLPERRRPLAWSAIAAAAAVLLFAATTMTTPSTQRTMANADAPRVAVAPPAADQLAAQELLRFQVRSPRLPDDFVKTPRSIEAASEDAARMAAMVRLNAEVLLRLVEQAPEFYRR